MKNPFSPRQQQPAGASASSSSEVFLRSPGEYSRNPVIMERECAMLALDYTEGYNLKALHDLTQRTGMPITQENGQRRYGPPLDPTISVPIRGSEVFVGKIPRDCFEPELVKVFEQAGRIYELRLMMDFSGTNRGYCFVHYFTPAEADNAVRYLNNFEIRSGHRIGVVKSVDNCRLFIGGIPKNKTQEEIRKEVDNLIGGVVKVIVYPSQQRNECNRGFAFLEFESHKAAAMARRKLVPGKLQMWGADVAVDWAEPEAEGDVLHVRNLNAVTSEQCLYEIFNSVSNWGVKYVRKLTRYAFVHFLSRAQAEMAKAALENVLIDDQAIEIQWAKSSDSNGKMFRKNNKVRIEFNLNSTPTSNFSPNFQHQFYRTPPNPYFNYSQTLH